MPKNIPTIPDMEVGLVIITPVRYRNITTNKPYVVEKTGNGTIFIRNDVGELTEYNSYQFMEADLYFTISLFSTTIKIFRLGDKAYK